MSLRDYQLNGIDLIKKDFSAGHTKVLLWLATGAGKTVIFCEMVKQSVARGKTVLIVVRGRLLVDNASKRLFREAVPHGVMMAGHWNYRPGEKVQVASIDTLIARGWKPKADLIIIDEAHMAISAGYKEFLEQYGKETFVIPVTATPYVTASLRHVADTFVHPITMQELIDQGHLCGFRYFAPSEPDLSGIKIVNTENGKDYQNKQLGERMCAGSLTGDIVKHYEKLGEERRAILFAVNIKHSKIICEMFNNAGIRAEHCEADTSDSERKDIIRRLEDGKTKVICNVGILCTGVDIPCLGAIIMARPTKSYNLYIQQAGRGTRLYDGKQNCLLIDHAGNIRRHDFPTIEPEVSLDGRVITEHHVSELKTCKICFCVFKGAICPECKTEVKKKDRGELQVNEGELSEIVVTESDPVKQYIQLMERNRGSRKPGWTYYKVIDKFGYEKSKPHLPAWFLKFYLTKMGTENGSDIFSASPYSATSGVKL